MTFQIRFFGVCQMMGGELAVEKPVWQRIELRGEVAGSGGSATIKSMSIVVRL